jgi:hypothetical protein
MTGGMIWDSLRIRDCKQHRIRQRERLYYERGYPNEFGKSGVNGGKDGRRQDKDSEGYSKVGLNYSEDSLVTQYDLCSTLRLDLSPPLCLWYPPLAGRIL